MCPSPALVAYIFPADPSLWLIAKTLHATFQLALCTLPAVTSGRCAVATTFALAFLPCHGRRNAIGTPKNVTESMKSQNCDMPTMTSNGDEYCEDDFDGDGEYCCDCHEDGFLDGLLDEWMFAWLNG